MYLPPHIDADRLAGPAGVGGVGVCRGDQMLGVRQEPLAGRGELDASMAAHQQLLAEDLLQPMDAFGQCLLGQVQHRGGTAEVQMFTDGQKGSHLGEIKVHAVSLAGR